MAMNPQRTKIAPVWHTVCLLTGLAVLAGLLKFMGLGSANPRASNLAIYLIGFAFEWALFGFTLWRTDAAFVQYAAKTVKTPRALLWDIPIAALLCGVLLGISPLIIRMIGPGGWDTTQGMLPKTGLERAVWVLISITAGITEETIFRGYLQQQIQGWTGFAAAGVIGQAVIFGVCHLYQGWKLVGLICIWGLVFGVFAHLRKGLRANMIAHAVLDSLSAVT